MKYKSIALWPKHEGIYDDRSEDTHDTEKQAQCVCRMLEKQGFGGDGVIFPIKTWVEPIKE